ncbi:glycoside hydrolase family 2 TIM barrel-domain containing protein [Salinibacterium sp. ZJ77]|uniref:glycoside hydrolase family 2 protein n=1 Tax=Salinibacterium sp. ZJ77 TaxID=2708337 RepID=UPI001FBB9F1A|nr:glycoside hydrolase family 2 TIM barrel-domain containing protein [Salinibacterium sp. ZJ77]
MLTRFGRELDPENVLPEHPRPQLVRDAWASLNGWWDCAITPVDAPRPAEWSDRILVPFSPEAPLSGLERTLTHGDALWYRLQLPEPPAGERVLLHIDASDRHTTVWLDDMQVGEHHDGFTPQTHELTEALARGGPRELIVRVTDPTDLEPGARGKQRLKRGGIWYTPQSGIWQTVWLEAVPRTFVERLELTPSFDASREATGELAVRVFANGPSAGPARVRVLDAGQVIAEAVVPPVERVVLPIPGARAWSHADPHLYDVEVELGDDRVASYTGIRSLGIVEGADGARRFTLNGEPVLHAGLLDQGYWPDGLLTPPSDAAMIADIEAARAAGFTMLRKHIKIEPARWYHHCDRLGMLVWQDAVNGGGRYHPLTITLPVASPFRLDDTRHRGLFARRDRADREAFEAALDAMIAHLGNHPSIIGWVPFNEGWGQFDAARIAAHVARLDPSRPVDHASGWHDQFAGDVLSLHVYFRRFRMPDRRRWRGRAVVLSEFGGYSWPVEGHRWNAREFGYRRYRDRASLAEAVTALWRDELAPATEQGLAGFVYTQLTDVEDEVNGLLTYDREVVKIDPELLGALNAELANIAARTAAREERA